MSPPHAHSRRRRARAWRVLRRALSLGAALLASPLSAMDEGALLVLEVAVNGRTYDQAVLARERNGDIWLMPEDLAALGLGDGESESEWLCLCARPDLTWQLDRVGQTLSIADPKRLAEANRYDLSERRPPPPVDRSMTAAVLNYDLSLLADDEEVRVAGAAELRIAFPEGQAIGGFRFGPALSSGGSQVVRLDSALVFHDPERRRRWVVGDFLTTPGAFGRPVRLAGLQLTSDFSTRPDLVTRPLPDLEGNVAVPSAFDLLVNGRRVEGGTLEAGSFGITNIPVITGRGTVQLAIRDAEGRERLESLSLYSSPDLLAPGLTETSAEIGLVRRDFGRRSFAYGAPAVSALHRIGVDERLTVQLHGELAGGDAVLFNAGSGASLALGGLALVSLDGAISRDGRDPNRRNWGYRYTLALESIGDPVSLTARYAAGSGDYRDLAALAPDRAPADELVVAAGFDLAALTGLPLGGLDLGYAWRGGLEDVADSEILTGAWRLGLGRADLSVNLFRTLGESGETAVLAGLTLPLGKGAIGALTADFRPGASSFGATAARPDLVAGDLGYRLDLQAGAIDRAAALASYRGDWGRVEAGLERVGRRRAARFTAQGAILMAPDAIFLGNWVDGAWAIVDTGGIGGVEIALENRPMGRTNGAGHLLIPRLNEWLPNRVALDPLSLPDLATISSAAADVRPSAGGALRIAFDVAMERPFRVLMVDETGRALPPGAIARPMEGGAALTIGYGGEMFLPDGSQPWRFAVEAPGVGPCLVLVDIPGEAEPLSLTGPFRCVVPPRLAFGALPDAAQPGGR